MVEETLNVPPSSEFLRRIPKMALSNIKQTRRRT